MRRWRIVLVLVGLLTVVGNGVQEGLAQGTSEAAHACQEGGWKQLRRIDGTLFETQGECVRYAAAGGTLVPLMSTGPDISIGYGSRGTSGPGTLSGTGFTSNTQIVTLDATFAPSDHSDDLLLHFELQDLELWTDGSGAFMTHEYIWWCFLPQEWETPSTSVDITVTDAAGVTHTETFALACT